MSESGIRKLFTGISAIFGGKKPSNAEVQDSVEDIDRLIEEAKKFQDTQQIDRAIPLLARAIWKVFGWLFPPALTVSNVRLVELYCAVSASVFGSGGRLMLAKLPLREL